MTEPHRVVVLGVADVVGFDVAIPPQIFGAARDLDGHPLYDVRVHSLDGGPIGTTKGFTIVPDPDPEFLREPDTLVVPGTHLPGPRSDG